MEPDKITKMVHDMYMKYPYPSPTSDITSTNELLNLLKIHEIENKIKLKNQKILDAGTGSGHRIINVAQHFPTCNFVGIDMSENSLAIATKLKEKLNLKNIQFKKLDIMKDTMLLEKFDIILCMGVLHHLSNPKKGLDVLSSLLNDDGMIFLYLYGKLGGHQRMLNKELISILLGNQKLDYELGIDLVRQIGLNKFDYGWNLNFKNKQEEDSVIVDSLLHANESLYDVYDIDALFQKTNLFGYFIFGITVATQGYIFDTGLEESKLKIPYTDISSFLDSKTIDERYASLPIIEKYRILDICYKPNGYTILGLTKHAYDKLENSRIKRNVIKLN